MIGMPYMGSKRKIANNIDHEVLYQWIRDSEYKIYLSEYDAPFEVVAEWKKYSLVGKVNCVKSREDVIIEVKYRTNITVVFS